MIDNTPKISFIPKTSLVQEQPFIQRKRPRNIINAIGAFVFFVVIGAYFSIYLYEVSLIKDIEAKTSDISSAQEAFEKAPEIAKAKIFRARSDVALELLKQHIIVSPVFGFIEKMTLKNIEYSSFTFKREGKLLIVDLKGEAPSYQSIAYQADEFHKKNNVIDSFSFSKLTLTNFGSVQFLLRLSFKRSYMTSLNARGNLGEADFGSAPIIKQTIYQATSTATTSVMKKPAVSTTSSAVSATATTSVMNKSDVSTSSSDVLVPILSPKPSIVNNTEIVPETEEPKKTFWSWFKF